MKQDIYTFSDTPAAAYLCMMGYTLLGAVDNGHEKIELALAHPDMTGAEFYNDLLTKIDEFNNMTFIVPELSDKRLSFKEYYHRYRMCLREIKNPIDVREIERNSK